MLIKVCGMADSHHLREVAGLYPDMVGFIFYRPSPRNAFGLVPGSVLSLPGGIKKVGVFVDEPEDTILDISSGYGLDTVQLHGNESPATCSRLRERGFKVIKAFGISPDADLAATGRYEDVCDLFVFDTKTPQKGGSGRKFDHALLECYRGRTPFLLSGGIGPEDAGIDVSRYPGCIGFDLNSRFETAPGLKDTVLLKKFIETVRNHRYEQDR